MNKDILLRLQQQTPEKNWLGEKWVDYNKQIAGDVKDEKLEPKENQPSDEYIKGLLDTINKIYFRKK